MMLLSILLCYLGGYPINIGSVVLWLLLPIYLCMLWFWCLLWLLLVFHSRGLLGYWYLLWGRVVGCG